jgi:hypothetical protein
VAVSIGHIGISAQYLKALQALVIIKEYSFFLWDRELTDDCVATVVNIYMQSPNCSAAKKAVDATFGGGSGHIFKCGIDGVCEVKETFRKKLVQIALDN